MICEAPSAKAICIPYTFPFHRDSFKFGAWDRFLSLSLLYVYTTLYHWNAELKSLLFLRWVQVLPIPSLTTSLDVPIIDSVMRKAVTRVCVCASQAHSNNRFNYEIMCITSLSLHVHFGDQRVFPVCVCICKLASFWKLNGTRIAYPLVRWAP